MQGCCPLRDSPSSPRKIAAGILGTKSFQEMVLRYRGRAGSHPRVRVQSARPAMAFMKAASRLRSVGKSPLAPAYDGRFARFHFHQKWATGALRASFQGTFWSNQSGFTQHSPRRPTSAYEVRFADCEAHVDAAHRKGPLPIIPTPVRSNYFDRISRRARSEIGAECLYHATSGHRTLLR